MAGVEESLYVAKADPCPERQADHWSVRKVLTKDEGEEVKEAENEEQGMEVGEVVPGMQPSSKETDGGFVMCKVEEQQAARVEVQGHTRRVTRAEPEETQDCVRSASSEPRGVYHWCANRCI